MNHSFESPDSSLSNCVRWLRLPDADSSALPLGVLHLSARQRISFHDCALVVHVVEGHVELDVDGPTYTMHTGDIGTFAGAHLRWIAVSATRVLLAILNHRDDAGARALRPGAPILARISRVDGEPETIETPSYSTSEVVVDGAPTTRIHWLHHDVGPECSLLAGVIRLDPAIVTGTFEYDEVVEILAGLVDLEIEGETWTLVPGDVVSCRKGQKATWRIHERASEFFIATTF